MFWFDLCPENKNTVLIYSPMHHIHIHADTFSQNDKTKFYIFIPPFAAKLLTEDTSTLLISVSGNVLWKVWGCLLIERFKTE